MVKENILWYDKIFLILIIALFYMISVSAVTLLKRQRRKEVQRDIEPTKQQALEQRHPNAEKPTSKENDQGKVHILTSRKRNSMR